jgi:Kef-type K+ transport system membrane component KefB
MSLAPLVRRPRGGPRSWLVVGAAAAPAVALASADGGPALSFFWIALLLIVGKVASLVERLRQPAVLGELVAGVVLGNLALFGFVALEPLKHDAFVRSLAELGVVVLLFQIGLESNLQEMRRVGARAMAVAVVGVVVPFALGTVMIGPLVFPDQSQNVYLFFGATLTATSVGITARVFKDLRFLSSPEARIVLGAAVIDDVIGLVILAVVSAIISTGSVEAATVAWIVVKAIGFLGAAVVIGNRAAPALSRLFSRIHTGTGMKFTVAVSLCLVLAFLAHAIGLAPIVGAFAAGLILDEVTFKDFGGPEIEGALREAVREADPEIRRRVDGVLGHHARHHLQSLIEPVGHLLVPLFFVFTGAQVNLATLADPRVLGIALVVTAVALAGKLVSGLVAGPVQRWVVGWGMAPRGEVGLIFAVVGKQLGVVNETQFSVIVVMVMLTTLLTPPVLAALIRRRQPSHERAPAAAPAASPLYHAPEGQNP